MQEGAHYLLQARTAAVNGDLPEHFERWYSGLTIYDCIEEGQMDNVVSLMVNMNK